MVISLCFRNAKVTQFSHTNFKRLQKVEINYPLPLIRITFPHKGGEPKMSPPRSPGADVTERLSYKRWQMSAGRNNSDSENQF